MALFGGCDWGGESHAICVVDETGAVRWRATMAHDAEGLEKLVQQLANWTGSRVADRHRATRGVAGRYAPGGWASRRAHPPQRCEGPADLATARRVPRATRATATFSRTCQLRTDGHRLAKLVPQSDAIKALRALVRTRDDLVAERVAIANQLRALLQSCGPWAAEIFAEVDSPIALAFVRR